MNSSSIKMTLLTVVLSLIMAEGVLQLAALASPRIALLLSPGIPRKIPDTALGFRPNPDLPDHDSRGYRNPVALEQADIVVMGDSQTYGSEVSRANAWPTLLGNELEVPTYNLAFSGWGPGQYYLLRDLAFAMKPKALIVALYSGNDFADAFKIVAQNKIAAFSGGSLHDREFYEEYEQREGSLSKQWQATRAARRGWFKTWSETILEPFEEHFKLYGLFRGLSRIKPASEIELQTDSVRDDVEKYAAKISHLSTDLFFPFRNGDLGTVFTPLARTGVTNRRDPRIEEGLRISLAVIKGLHDRCGEDCEFIVVTIPTKELAYSVEVAKSDVEPPQAYQDLVLAESALWEYVHAELESLGITVIDARVALGQAIRDGRNPYLTDWDGHPNVLGNRVIAEHVATHPILQGIASH